MSRYPLFDRSRIQLSDLKSRRSRLGLSDCLALAEPPTPYVHPDFDEFVLKLLTAVDSGRQVVLMMGGHPIKAGLSRFLVDLIERRLVTHLAMNGGALVHDYELSTFAETSEDVAEWIKVGRFGLWQQTSRLNDIIQQAAAAGLGIGEAVGRIIEEQSPPGRPISVTAAAWRAEIPATCHLTIGADIIHAMPNCDGGALGAAAYTDFLIFTKTIQQLNGGVFINLGTAITGPEVFLKALSMARNVESQFNRDIDSFATAVFDIIDIPDSFRDGPPDENHPLYYYRPWKTLLCRAVGRSAKSFYFRGDHRQTLPTLWHELTQRSARSSEAKPSTHADFR